MPTDYLSIKKMYAEKLELYKSIECDNINCLDIFIFGSIQKLVNPFETMLIMSKYAFVVNKLDIHKIYVQEDYDKKYKDILPYLKHVSCTDQYLNYNIALVILDILFKKGFGSLIKIDKNILYIINIINIWKDRKIFIIQNQNI